VPPCIGTELLRFQPMDQRAAQMTCADRHTADADGPRPHNPDALTVRKPGSDPRTILVPVSAPTPDQETYMTRSVDGRRLGGLVTLALVMCTAVASAQTRVDLGKREYDSNCASCHGADGKGGGPVVELLKRSPPDLTTMARRNGGVFPVSYAYDVIEGKGHGGRDMPFWGQQYNVKAAEYYVDVPYDAQVLSRGLFHRVPVTHFCDAKPAIGRIGSPGERCGRVR
jgi:hypothetical protein